MNFIILILFIIIVLCLNYEKFTAIDISYNNTTTQYPYCSQKCFNNTSYNNCMNDYSMCLDNNENLIQNNCKWSVGSKMCYY